MFQFYLFCAVIGSTILVAQLALTIMGLAGSEFEFGDDVPSDFDMPDGEFAIDGIEVGDAEVGDLDTSSSNSAFGRLSFRAVVAAMAFFGIAGVASMQSGMTVAPTLALSCLMGFGAMLGVAELMKTMYRLGHDGTVRVEDTIGRSATVYLPVPGNRDGKGRVQVHMDDRIMEYEAVTSGALRLATGASVVVTDVLGPTLLEVDSDLLVAVNAVSAVSGN